MSLVLRELVAGFVAENSDEVPVRPVDDGPVVEQRDEHREGSLWHRIAHSTPGRDVDEKEDAA